MAREKTRKVKRYRRDRQFPNSWVPWLVLSLVLVIAAAVAIVAIRQESQNARALPAAISAETAWAMVQENNAVIVDVRSTKDWNNYHITNSKSIPLADLPTRLKELPRNAPIIVVDDYLDLSPQGRAILLRAGFSSVSVLTGGILDWATKGYPVIGNVPD